MMGGRRTRKFCCWRLSTWIKAIGWLQIIFFACLTWRTAAKAAELADTILEQKRMKKTIEDGQYGAMASLASDGGSGSSSILIEFPFQFSRSALQISNTAGGGYEFFPGWNKLKIIEGQNILELASTLLVLEIYFVFGLITGILLVTAVSKRNPNFLTAWTIFAAFSLVIFLLLAIVVVYLLSTLFGLTRLLLVLVFLVVSVIWSIWMVRKYKQELEVELICAGRRSIDDEEARFFRRKSGDSFQRRHI